MHIICHILEGKFRRKSLAAERVEDWPGASFVVAWLNDVNNWERTKLKYII